MDFSSSKLDRLYKHVYDTFIELPQVARLAVYGSSASNRYDEFSDLDIEIQLSEWNGISLKIESILKKIGTPYVIFPAINKPGYGVLTVLWKDFPFYQKLDARFLSLDVPISERSEVVYEGKNKVKNDNRHKKVFNLSFNESYRPFYDLFIGATRYTKHRKRKENISAFKFYRSGLDSLVRLYIYDLDSGVYTDNPISIEDFKKIDRDYKNLNRTFSEHILMSNLSMDSFFIGMLQRYLSESIKNELIKKSSPEEDFGQNVLKFVQNELF